MFHKNKVIKIWIFSSIEDLTLTDLGKHIFTFIKNVHWNTVSKNFVTTLKKIIYRERIKLEIELSGCSSCLIKYLGNFKVHCCNPCWFLTASHSFSDEELLHLFFLWRIEDPDEAQDHFIVARSNCKGFAFVHIAYAQFEVSQGTMPQFYSPPLQIFFL